MATTIQRLRQLPIAEREARLKRLTPHQRIALRYGWAEHWARPEQQIPNGAWDVWLVMAGRGWGKTRVGAEFAIDLARRLPRIAIAARTAADVRDVCIEGESGILACSPPWFRPHYEPSKRRLTWPNGSIATTFSADEPAQARGPQHYGGWYDELAAWKYFEAFDMLQMGMRLGAHPRVCVTTTPRPLRALRELAASKRTHLTHGSTYDNADNLAPAFLGYILDRYEGTTLGEQELYARLLDEAKGALWNRAQMLDAHRVQSAPQLERIVVAIDPAVTSKSGSDETGIVAAGSDRNGHVYVLSDASGILKPEQWARRAVAEFEALQADRIVGEANNGGELVESNLRHTSPDVPVTLVHASRGKRTRAEPVSSLYERGRVHHVGTFPDLEDQLCTWEPGISTDSPDRLDALVWAVTELVERRTGDIAAGFAAGASKGSRWRV